MSFVELDQGVESAARGDMGESDDGVDRFATIENVFGTLLFLRDTVITQPPHDHVDIGKFFFESALKATFANIDSSELRVNSKNGDRAAAIEDLRQTAG